MQIEELKARFSAIKTASKVKEELVAKQLADIKLELDGNVGYVETLKKVNEVLTKVAELSRRDTINRLEQLISYALQTILDEPSYKFFIQEREQRNGVVYQFMYEKFGQPPLPVGSDSSGGGVGDIVSNFLAIIIPILLNPKGRRFVALDERFKHLSSSHLGRVAAVLRFLSDKLGIQFLIITQREGLIKAADVAYMFSTASGLTKVNNIEVSND